MSLKRFYPLSRLILSFILFAASAARMQLPQGIGLMKAARPHQESSPESRNL
jgi:hypothetical protein